MSNIELHPGISGLNEDSLCYSLYIQLYNNFFQAQIKKDTDHPWGIAEGDETSVRLRNTAYNFADAIAGAINKDDEGGVNGNILLDFLKKSGGDMFGKLTANTGFEAGIFNTRILETYYLNEQYGLRIYGNLNIGSDNLYIGGKQVIVYDKNTDKTCFSSSTFDFGQAAITSKGEILVGSDKSNGIFINPTGIQIAEYDVFHTGNANQTTIDWSMKDALIGGKLTVSGSTFLSGNLKACSGAELGINNKALISFSEENINTTGFISFATSYGILINNIPVLTRVSNTDIQLGAVGGDLLLGSANTQKTRLQANIATNDGEYILLTKYGGAYFPDSIQIRHNYGETLFSSYRKDNTDEGIIIHKRLRFTDTAAAYLYGKDKGIVFASNVNFIDSINGTQSIITYNTLLKYIESTSLYKDLSKKSASLVLATEADFINTDKPFEAKGHIGIDSSFTRLTDGALIFNNENYLLSSADGIKYFGNAYFIEDLSSERFSSGFAGSGWAIMKNKVFGHIAATFDELTVRKKMRIYELEVQKISATNGSLWISDNCKGDTVIKL